MAMDPKRNDDRPQETFMEALVSCAIHGELTEPMALQWFDPEDHELAIKVIRSKHLHRKRYEFTLLKEIAGWACGDTDAQRAFARVFGERLAPYGDPD